MAVERIGNLWAAAAAGESPQEIRYCSGAVRWGFREAHYAPQEAGPAGFEAAAFLCGSISSLPFPGPLSLSCCQLPFPSPNDEVAPLLRPPHAAAPPHPPPSQAPALPRLLLSLRLRLRAAPSRPPLAPARAVAPPILLLPLCAPQPPRDGARARRPPRGR